MYVHPPQNGAIGYAPWPYRQNGTDEASQQSDSQLRAALLDKAGVCNRLLLRFHLVKILFFPAGFKGNQFHHWKYVYLFQGT